MWAEIGKMWNHAFYLVNNYLEPSSYPVRGTKQCSEEFIIVI